MKTVGKRKTCMIYMNTKSTNK